MGLGTRLDVEGTQEAGGVGGKIPSAHPVGDGARTPSGGGRDVDGRAAAEVAKGDGGAGGPGLALPGPVGGSQDGPVCGYPGCGRRCAPAEGPGRPPAYCDDPAHTRLSAYRRRRELAAAGGEGGSTAGADRTLAASRPAAAVGTGPKGAVQARPVALARLRADELAAHVATLAADLGRTLEAFTTTLGRLGDLGAAEVQVEAAEVDAARRVAEATARAVRAEAEGRAQAAARADAEAVTAEATVALEELEGRLAATDAALLAARAQAEEADQRAAEEIAAARAQAAAQVEAARAQARADIVTARAEADERAESARADAAARLATIRATAEREMATLRGKLAASHAELAGVRRDAKSASDVQAELRAELTALREAAAADRAAAAAALDRARADAATEMDRLRRESANELTRLRDELARARAAADAEAARIRAEAVAAREADRLAVEERMAVLTEARADARARAERAERHADALAAQLEQRPPQAI